MERLNELMTRWRMHWEFLEPVEFKGLPKQEELEAIFERGAQLARNVKRELQPLDNVNHLKKESAYRQS